MNLSDSKYNSMLKSLIKGNIHGLKINGAEIATDEDLQEKAQVWYVDEDPTLENAPYVGWGDGYAKHDGDLCYSSASGNLFRFSAGDGSPGWVLLQDRLETGVGEDTEDGSLSYIKVLPDGTLVAKNARIIGTVFAKDGEFTGKIKASEFVLKEAVLEDEYGNQFGSDFSTTAAGIHFKFHVVKQSETDPVSDTPSAYIDIGGMEPVYDTDGETVLYFDELPTSIYGKKGVNISSLYDVTLSGSVGGDINLETVSGDINLSKSPIVEGHNSAIGSKRTVVSNHTNHSTTSGNTYSIGSGTLPAGTWLVMAAVYWGANASGNRFLKIGSTATDINQSYGRTDVRGVGAANAMMQNLTTVITVDTTTTFYLNCMQNSGAAVNAAGELTAVRLL